MRTGACRCTRTASRSGVPNRDRPHRTPPHRRPPVTPIASAVTGTGVTLSWTASTDTGGSGLAGYAVFGEIGATDVLIGTTTTNTRAVTGLTPATAYQFLW